ncbi:hypothetical protein HPA02_34610 [Bisbaumannia pacifica]|uniref:Uncharacterized protein n=1 Tax=Bisbaumannia pacifica TaxID=77098 RepID=A0A510XCN8_9GAMM|nr:hypothetical protein HPA02_34610 [Halomonas pacifica]
MLSQGLRQKGLHGDLRIECAAGQGQLAGIKKPPERSGNGYPWQVIGAGYCQPPAGLCAALT